MRRSILEKVIYLASSELKVSEASGRIVCVCQEHCEVVELRCQRPVVEAFTAMRAKLALRGDVTCLKGLQQCSMRVRMKERCYGKTAKVQLAAAPHSIRRNWRWGDVFNLAQSTFKEAMRSESSLARRVKSSLQFTPLQGHSCTTMHPGEKEHVGGSGAHIARGVLEQRSKGTVKLEVVTEVLLCLGNRE